MTVIGNVGEANYSCFGVRKLWKAINREYAHRFSLVARCTVDRLMRQLGIGAGPARLSELERGKHPNTELADAYRAGATAA